MNKQMQELALALTLGRISKEEFLKQFPEVRDPASAFLPKQLETALKERDSDAVEHLMLLGFQFGFGAECAEVLCELILQDWHMQHENIAMVLQNLRLPGTVDCLYRAALVEFPYLDYDESYALGVKCLYALQAIGSDDAKAKLGLIAGGDNPVLAENAQRLLRSLETGGQD